MITIASEAEAGVFNSIAIACAFPCSLFEDIFAPWILFDASVCGTPKLELLLNDPAIFLNFNSFFSR